MTKEHREHKEVTELHEVLDKKLSAERSQSISQFRSSSCLSRQASPKDHTSHAEFSSASPKKHRHAERNLSIS